MDRVKIARELVKIAKEIIDYRCPRCEEPMVGSEDVVDQRGKAPRKLKCQNCGYNGKLVGDMSGEVDYYYASRELKAAGKIILD